VSLIVVIAWGVECNARRHSPKRRSEKRFWSFFARALPCDFRPAAETNINGSAYSLKIPLEEFYKVLIERMIGRHPLVLVTPWFA
jgi:hypothetical protein